MLRIIFLLQQEYYCTFSCNLKIFWRKWLTQVLNQTISSLSLTLQLNNYLSVCFRWYCVGIITRAMQCNVSLSNLQSKKQSTIIFFVVVSSQIIFFLDCKLKRNQCGDCLAYFVAMIAINVCFSWKAAWL